MDEDGRTPKQEYQLEGHEMRKMMIPRHKNTLFHQNFPFKAVIALDEMKTHSLDMKQQYQKQKGKSSPNILCLTGREVHNGHIQFERSVPRVI